ncbi:hypothetical protein L6164_000328 [Bauhinia variegata]|uniref:Uncharacterized protein n=1 Tax=Bauhinia variegata TaxID=167791 RepID=A0ACB9Q8Y9_BAUVA|nr:hypothetical protein L6164_000328 [Bauhinia variegata]
MGARYSIKEEKKRNNEVDGSGIVLLHKSVRIPRKWRQRILFYGFPLCFHQRREAAEMTSYLWRKYADYLYTKWERTILWDMVDPYRRPKTFTPLVTIYIAAFYTGVVGAAITEQLYKEKYWEEHPGEAVPLMKPKFYGGPWRVMRGEVPPTG